MRYTPILPLIALLFACSTIAAQPPRGIHWSDDGEGFYQYSDNEIDKVNLSDKQVLPFVTSKELTPVDSSKPLFVRNFFVSDDGKKVLIYTNSKKVWRYDTRGDYWVVNLITHRISKLGKGMEPSSLMFAKFSPDSKKVAYVSKHNIYVEDLSSGAIRPLTKDGTTDIINGTFDWAYEEEFDCRDGFRWSPDSKKIAYWQMDAKNTKDYLMIDNTDSLYPFVRPVVYPIAGEPPSPFKIGVVALDDAKTSWMKIPTDPVLRSYLPRMEWADDDNQLIVQHLNRRQNVSDIMLCDIKTGASKTIYEERDSAWIDILPEWDEAYWYGGWDWLNDGKEFLWASEKDGWRHLYRISRDGKKETLITKGDYDVMKISAIDEKDNYIYFEASPYNATQSYLYRTKLDGTDTAERVTPGEETGTNSYEVNPRATYAYHSFSNYYTRYQSEWISLPGHIYINGDDIPAAIDKAAPDKAKSNITFFTVKVKDGTTMDAWMVKPAHFDSTKKYPVVFYVYTEPAAQTVTDRYGIGRDFLYDGSLSDDGYIYVSIDNPGTPAPKGNAWRKAIYKKIGLVNIRYQALAAEQILKLPYVDTSRVAVWGWSGGASATLNLMFQYPQIYKTGIAIAAVANERTYDNIYEERYMGLPQEDPQAYIDGSPITYAKNLQGNLLYIHGTGDDNVHFNNAEMLLNALIKYNKQFQFMEYPNRTHDISEGPGTREHLRTLYTRYLRQYCPPGGR
jgi:dipeptidyl-peptidase 4